MSLVGFKARNHQQQLVAHGPALDVDERITEPAWFATLERRFGGFTVDVAALPRNAKCERFFTPDDDGLTQSWASERVWCNPPFSAIEPWVEKSWDEPSAFIVMLVPANRTEQGWWQRHVEPRRDGGGRLSVEFLPGRIRFLLPGQSAAAPNTRPPFGCALLVWQAT